jgi:MFS transporter, PAT family, beta-lactamase induction signal transducer AmpG
MAGAPTGRSRYLAENRRLRLAVLCGLYVAQGIPWGFVTITLAAHLAASGADAGAIGNVTALVTLPWAFKWLFAPFVDRFSRSRMGRRRPWFVFAQGMLATVAAVVILVPSLNEDLGLLEWIVLAMNGFAALGDVALDAMAVDLLSEEERGRGSGLMYGATYLGLAIGGAGLSILLGNFGLRTALVAQVVVLVAIMALALAFRERRGDAYLSLGSHRVEAAAIRSTRALVTNLGRSFARRSPILCALWMFVVLAGGQAVAAVLPVIAMQELGWDQATYGERVGGWPMLVGLAGSLAGGFLADGLGRRRAVALASILLGLVWLGFAAARPHWASPGVVTGFALANEGCLGLVTVASFTLCMDVAWPRVAATQFTAFMALGNLGRTAGAKLAGPATAALGAAGAFALFGAVQIAIVVLLVPLDPGQNRRELGD